MEYCRNPSVNSGFALEEESFTSARMDRESRAPRMLTRAAPKLNTFAKKM
jgi:hypothetical protein